jgi:hypothetical protein
MAKRIACCELRDAAAQIAGALTLLGAGELDAWIVRARSE